MYFPVLKALKVSEELDPSNLALFDSLLYLIYERKFYQRFHPRIYKKLGFPLNETKWVNVLTQLMNYGCLRVNYELCCPESSETINTFSKYDDIPFGSEIACPNCGYNFYINEKDIYITYTFEDIFKPLPSAGSDTNFFLERALGKRNLSL